MNTELIANIVLQNNDIVGEVYQAPRVSASSSNTVNVRIIENKSKILIHITAPDPEILEKAVREILGDDAETFIEWCG